MTFHRGKHGFQNLKSVKLMHEYRELKSAGWIMDINMNDQYFFLFKLKNVRGISEKNFEPIL